MDTAMAASSFNTSVFVGTGNPRWGYDPYCYSYYDYTPPRYYDPYLNGYYPVGYRPPVGLRSLPSLRLASGKRLLPPAEPRLECDDSQLPQPRVGLPELRLRFERAGPTASARSAGRLRRRQATIPPETNYRPPPPIRTSRPSARPTQEVPGQGRYQINEARPAGTPLSVPLQHARGCRPAAVFQGTSCRANDAQPQAASSQRQITPAGTSGQCPRTPPGAHPPQAQRTQPANPRQAKAREARTQPTAEAARGDVIRNRTEESAAPRATPSPPAAPDRGGGVPAKPAAAATSARRANPPCHRRSGRRGPFGTSRPSP